MFQIDLLLFLFVLCQCVIGENVHGMTENAYALPEVEVNEIERDSLFARDKSLTSTFYRVTKKYECKWDREGLQHNSVSLLYGTRAWTFPRQDVNLELKYPTAKTFTEYYITKVTVILHLDGSQSRGYIKKGGILDNHIEMNFIVKNTTRLAYQFWLNGIPANELNLYS